MSIFQSGLLKHQARKTRLTTLVAAIIAAVFLLGYPRVLRWRDVAPLLFILGHCIALTLATGRNSNGELAFLHTRGFSRDRVWIGTLGANVISILTVWGLAALTVWTPLRSRAQFTAGNPLFPIMAPVEHSVPWAWLMVYAVALPLIHYAWVRQGQPTRGRIGVVMLVTGAILVAMRMLISFPDQPWMNRLAIAVMAVTTIASLTGARLLYRKLEVRS